MNLKAAPDQCNANKCYTICTLLLVTITEPLIEDHTLG